MQFPWIGFVLQMICEGIQRDGTSADANDESWSPVGLVRGAASGFQQAEVGTNYSPSP